MYILATRLDINKVSAIEERYCSALVSGEDGHAEVVEMVGFAFSEAAHRARSDAATWLYQNFRLVLRNEKNVIISSWLRQKKALELRTSRMFA